jgi:hypothetical protein
VLGALLQGNTYTQHFAGCLDLVRLTSVALYTGAFAPPRTWQPDPNRRADLAWTAAPNPLVAGYNIYRSVDGGTAVRLNPVLVASGLYSDLLLPEGALCYSVATVDTLGRESGPSTPQCIQSQTTAAELTPSARSFGLDAAPNPFNPVTTLSFDLPRAAVVRVTIYDVRGRHVITLLDAQLTAGHHVRRWDGRDAQGRHVPSGTYFAHLHAGELQARRKLVLLQ